MAFCGHVAITRRHPGLDPGSSVIKSLIAKDLFTAQTRRGWMPGQARHDGESFLTPSIKKGRAAFRDPAFS
ncbi:hypothetical protein AGR13a_Cc250115 [Agrobacterium genomosp. 13 str. CFBP 6927]|uniref:Uncharacterized protein n=1 Tax=Agrobacterium genomosp. 13 str. CFBP 6927 TaxID=1183428 RepID=A0ABP2BFF1_9HYPH|nr:hypothetical protein AGR13a_Cc250115 [Agrobacterium genomosp. 13 str. CFBP 6927]